MLHKINILRKTANILYIVLAYRISYRSVNLKSQRDGETDTTQAHERVSTNYQSPSSQRLNQKTLKHTHTHNSCV